MNLRDAIRELAQELINQTLVVVRDEFHVITGRYAREIIPLLDEMAPPSVKRAPRRAPKKAAKRPGRPAKKAAKKAPAKKPTKAKKSAKKHAGKKSRKG